MSNYCYDKKVNIFIITHLNVRFHRLQVGCNATNHTTSTNRHKYNINRGKVFINLTSKIEEWNIMQHFIVASPLTNVYMAWVSCQIYNIYLPYRSLPSKDIPVITWWYIWNTIHLYVINTVLKLNRCIKYDTYITCIFFLIIDWLFQNDRAIRVFGPS